MAAAVPVCAAVQLRHALAPGFGVQGVHVLGHQPVQLAQLLPVSQHQVSLVWLVGGELGPAHKVPRPVALAGAGAADELGVLDWPSVRPGVEPHALGAVIGDPRLRGDPSPSHHKQPLGVRNKALQLLHFHGIWGETGWHESQVWRGSGYRMGSEMMRSDGSEPSRALPGREHVQLKGKNGTHGR